MWLGEEVMKKVLSATWSGKEVVEEVFLDHVFRKRDAAESFGD
jgi:hypothetical protein